MRRLSLSLTLVLLAACSSDKNNGGAATGGSTGSGGARSGGSTGSGGARTGGTTGSGGTTTTGGSTGSGGTTSTGGSTGSGGSAGAPGSGGTTGDAGGDTSGGDTSGDTGTPGAGTVIVYAASNTGYGTPTTIHALKFDTATGALTAGGPTVAAGNNAAYVGFSPDRKFAYALNEATMTTLTSYGVNSTTGALTKINSVMALADAVHLSVDPTGKYLVTAHYTGADVTVHELAANGSIGMLTDTKKSAPVGTAMPRAHHTLFDKSGANLFVSSLGAGHFAQFKFAAGKLTANEPYVPVGAEARHLVIDQAEKFAYAVTEKEATVVTFSYDKTTGKLSTPTSMDASVNEKGGGSRVVLHPNGKFLYVGSRFDNSIITFAVDATTGKLTRGKDTHDSLSYPREFAIDPTGGYLVAGTQPNAMPTVPANALPMGGGNVVVFKIDATDGSLTKVGTPMKLQTNIPYVGIVKLP